MICISENALVRKNVPMAAFLIDRFASGLPWDIVKEQFKTEFDADLGSEEEAWHILETTTPGHLEAIEKRRDEQMKAVQSNDLPSKILKAIDHMYEQGMNAMDAREKAALFSQFARLYEILSKREDFKKGPLVQNVVVLQNNYTVLLNLLTEDLGVALTEEQKKRLRRLFRVPDDEQDIQVSL